MTQRNPEGRAPVAKRRLLETLGRAALLEYAKAYGIGGLTGLRKGEIVDALAGEPEPGVGDILAEMTRDELKAACRDLGLSDHGRAKKVLIERLEGWAEAQGGPEPLSGVGPGSVAGAGNEANAKAGARGDSGRAGRSGRSTSKAAAGRGSATGRHSVTEQASKTDLDYAETLWKAADTLRGQVDAAEYKHVVLGLLFLKYISDSFEARREELKAELEAEGISGPQLEGLLENRDEYTAERVFWVPPEARWTNLQNQATRSEIASLIDDAILAVERDNPGLKRKLPRDYARRGIAAERMKGLIDLIADIGFKADRGKARDTLGRVYEYFLGKFAAAEGKLGGEFYTPRCIVRLLVEMLEPYEGRVYDPCCGSGGMFVQSERFVEAHGGLKTDIAIYGQESNPTTWRLAHMNLAIHAIEANLGERSDDTFLRNLHPDLKADYILANPPFNVSDWSGQLLREDARWRYGTPPVGNANYAWIQHFIHHLAPSNGHGGGVAGFVMANGSLSSNSGGEGEIRQRIVEADLVDCIVACPAQLFYTTGIPVCLWFLTRDKTGRNLPRGGRDRRGETLFIDARKLGTMQSRTLRVLTGGDDGETLLADGLGDPNHDSDIGRIVYAFRQWRGEPAPEWWDEATHGEWAYRDIPGFCKSAKAEEVAKHGFVLTPGRYVGAEEQEDDGEPFEEKYPRLVAELEACFAEGERLTDAVRQNLSRVRPEGVDVEP